MCVHVLCAQLCAREWGRTQASCENRPRGCKGRGIVKCSIVEEYQKEASRRQTSCSSSDSHTPQVQQQKPSRKEVSFLPVAPLDSTHSSLFCRRLSSHSPLLSPPASPSFSLSQSPRMSFISEARFRWKYSQNTGASVKICADGEALCFPSPSGFM